MDAPMTQPPLAALARGPVWVVDAIRGDRECSAHHAEIAAHGNERALVLYDEESLVAVIAVRDVLGYGTAPDIAATIVYVFGGRWD